MKAETHFTHALLWLLLTDAASSDFAFFACFLASAINMLAFMVKRFAP